MRMTWADEEIKDSCKVDAVDEFARNKHDATAEPIFQKYFSGIYVSASFSSSHKKDDWRDWRVLGSTP
jgi:hypothetical protein